MNPQTPNTINLPLPSKKGHPLLVQLVLSGLLIIALAFGIWAFMGKSSSQTNVNGQIATAVAAAKLDQAKNLQAQFDEASKSPNRTFTGSATYGSVTFSYPKTWAGYSASSSASSRPIDNFFFPNIVPSTQSDTAFALRVVLTSDDYASVVSSYNSQVTAGTLKSSAFTPAKLKSNSSVQPGVRLDGTLSTNKNGSMVILKVRDKTLQISTESNDYLSDFNNTVLPSLTFAP